MLQLDIPEMDSGTWTGTIPLNHGRLEPTALVTTEGGVLSIEVVPNNLNE